MIQDYILQDRCGFQSLYFSSGLEPPLIELDHTQDSKVTSSYTEEGTGKLEDAADVNISPKALSLLHGQTISELAYEPSAKKRKLKPEFESINRELPQPKLIRRPYNYRRKTVSRDVSIGAVDKPSADGTIQSGETLHSSSPSDLHLGLMHHQHQHHHHHPPPPPPNNRRQNDCHYSYNGACYPPSSNLDYVQTTLGSPGMPAEYEQVHSWFFEPVSTDGYMPADSARTLANYSSKPIIGKFQSQQEHDSNRALMPWTERGLIAEYEPYQPFQYTYGNPHIDYQQRLMSHSLLRQAEPSRTASGHYATADSEANWCREPAPKEYSLAILTPESYCESPDSIPKSDDTSLKPNTLNSGDHSGVNTPLPLEKLGRTISDDKKTFATKYVESKRDALESGDKGTQKHFYTNHSSTGMHQFQINLEKFGMTQSQTIAFRKIFDRQLEMLYQSISEDFNSKFRSTPIGIEFVLQYLQRMEPKDFERVIEP